MSEQKAPDPPPPQPKSGESGTVRRELDQIARQLKGLSDRVKRLKDTA